MSSFVVNSDDSISSELNSWNQTYKQQTTTTTKTQTLVNNCAALFDIEFTSISVAANDDAFGICDDDDDACDDGIIGPSNEAN